MASTPASSVKSLTTPTPTPAPTTAREAQALATVLAEQESALARAQRLASDEARFTEAGKILATDAVEADAERTATANAWNEATADPAVGLEGLFAAFVAMRVASAIRAGIVGQASGIMGGIRPLRNENSGQPQAYRNDVQDPLFRAEFGQAVEGAITSRVEAQARQARHATQERSASAGDAAAAKVKV